LYKIRSFAKTNHMKQTIIACLVTAACCMGFSAIYTAVVQIPIPDHSERFKKLDAQNELVRQRETILMDSLMALERLYFDLQADVKEFGVNAANATENMTAYEKELKAIKVAVKITHYQDSSKTAILNGLSK